MPVWNDPVVMKGLPLRYPDPVIVEHEERGRRNAAENRKGQEVLRHALIFGHKPRSKP